MNTTSPAKVYVVIPCYNEEEALPITTKTMSAFFDEMIKDGLFAPDSRMLLVDDGSRDKTWTVIENLVASSEKFEGLKLAHNAGHQNALWAGMTAASQKEKDRYRIEKIGYIFQDFKLINEMTVADNIGILRLEGIDVSGMDEMLQALDIYEKKNARIKHLSGGQKQRVAIARALVKKPDIILADEPTGNLNFAIGEQVIRQLVEVSKGKTLIAVTHDDRLAKYFDEIIDMNEMTSGMQDVPSGKEDC